MQQGESKILAAVVYRYPKVLQKQFLINRNININSIKYWFMDPGYV